MRYPEHPGSKGTEGTSQAAAASIAGHTSHLRRRVLKAFAKHGELTALELIDRMEESRWSIQPRISELRALGLVESTGERRRKPSGKSGAVQRITALGWEVLK